MSTGSQVKSKVSKTAKTSTGSKGSQTSSTAATEALANAILRCAGCQKMIVEGHYQKVFKPNGDPIAYHIRCLICGYCKTVIEDHYVWQGEELYHRQCSWQKLIADANKQQQVPPQK